MLEAYDREKAGALLKEARAITADLKSEMGKIATQMSHVLDGDEEGADEIEEVAAGEPERPGAANPATARQEPSAGRSFWQFWR